MEVCVILISILVLEFSTRVDARFYLEWSPRIYAGIVTDLDFSWILYECNVYEDADEDDKSENFSFGRKLICRRIESSRQKRVIYAVANFYSVSGVTLLPDHFMELDDQSYTEDLPYVVTVGTTLSTYHRPGFRPTCPNKQFIQDKVFQLIVHFVDFADTVDIEPLVFYFSINNVGYFFAASSKPEKLFASYAAILNTVTGVFGYYVKNDSWWTLIKKRSADVRSIYRSKSQALFRILNRVKSKYKPARPKSLSKSMSPSHALSLSHSLSKSQSLGQPNIMELIGFLAFKMFDPCFILHFIDEEMEKAHSFCSVYCRFLSMAAKVYGVTYYYGCNHLPSGRCVDRTCTCDLRCAYVTKTVNMAFCNNIIRFYVYKNVGKYALWPVDV